ncbi:MAG: aldehyde dehydrogenase family protein, partial [Microbacterium sp.]
MTELLTVRDTPITLKHPDRLFIGGQWVTPQCATFFDVIDSATEESFYRVAEAGPADMDAAVTAARHAFDTTDWALLEPAERAVYLRRIAQKLHERATELATFWTRQAGPVFRMSSYSILRVPPLFEYYADLADEFEWERPAK